MEREVLRNAFTKSATLLYPYKKEPAVKGLRGMVTWNIERCIGCDLCPKICPTEAIEVTGEKRNAEITYHLDRCIFCGECVDICPTNTIETTQEYELASTCRDEMIIHYKRENRVP